MDVAIYVAIAENGVIGRDGGLPWRLSTDLKRFKADTMGKPIIMGRKTYEGIRPAAAGQAEHRRHPRQGLARRGRRGGAFARRRDHSWRRCAGAAWPASTRSASSAAARSMPRRCRWPTGCMSRMCWPRSTATRISRRSIRISGALVSAAGRSGRRKGQPCDALFGLRAAPRRALRGDQRVASGPKSDDAGSAIALKARRRIPIEERHWILRRNTGA